MSKLADYCVRFWEGPGSDIASGLLTLATMAAIIFAVAEHHWTLSDRAELEAAKSRIQVLELSNAVVERQSAIDAKRLDTIAKCDEELSQCLGKKRGK